MFDPPRSHVLMEPQSSPPGQGIGAEESPNPVPGHSSGANRIEHANDQNPVSRLSAIASASEAMGPAETTNTSMVSHSAPEAVVDFPQAIDGLGPVPLEQAPTGKETEPIAPLGNVHHDLGSGVLVPDSDTGSAGTPATAVGLGHQALASGKPIVLSAHSVSALRREVEGDSHSDRSRSHKSRSRTDLLAV